jgi:hypothetical protein
VSHLDWVLAGGGRRVPWRPAGVLSEVTDMDVRPDQIVSQRFGLRFFGADRKEVRQSLLDAATVLGRLREQLTLEMVKRGDFERALSVATRETETLQRGLAAAQARLRAYQQLEWPSPDALVTTQRVFENAHARVDEITAAAERSAGEVVGAARAAAADIVISARALAQQVLRAAERVANAERRRSEDETARIFARTEHRVSLLEHEIARQAAAVVDRLCALAARLKALLDGLDTRSETVIGVQTGIEREVMSDLTRMLLRLSGPHFFDSPAGGERIETSSTH